MPAHRVAVPDQRGQPVNAVTWPLVLPVLGAVLFVAAAKAQHPSAGVVA